MDSQQFDELSKRFSGTSLSRRSGWQLLPFLVVSALVRAEPNDVLAGKKGKGKGKGKPECKGDQDCDRRYLPGLNCEKGRCVCKRGGNCTGCCRSSTVCVLAENQNYTACGLGGKKCEECSNGVACDRDLGACVCSPDVSCTGCCYDNGKRCHPTGVDNKLCGIHSLCVDCTKDGRVCQYNHTCCVPVGGACDDTNANRRCCAQAGVSCREGVCSLIK